MSGLEPLCERTALRSNTHTFTLVLFAVVVLMLILLVGVGSSTYEHVVDTQVGTADKRASLSYLVSRVKAQDAQSSCAKASGPQGDALVLREQDGDEVFETRIYLYAGNLVEEYAPEGRAFSPTSAQVIVSCSRFEFEFVSNDLLFIMTDAGSQYVALHSVQPLPQTSTTGDVS